MTDMEKSHIDELLQSKDFASLASKLSQDIVEKPSTKVSKSAKARKELWQKSGDELDLNELAIINDQLQSYVDEYFLNRIEPKQDQILTQEQIDKLGEEAILVMRAIDFFTARQEEFKKIANVHFNSVNSEADTPVEQTDGKLESTAGPVFHRYGGTRKKPTINVDVLFSILKANQIAAIFDKVEIPAHTEFKFSEEKLMDALGSGIVSLEDVRQALELGEWQSPKFQIKIPVGDKK